MRRSDQQLLANEIECLIQIHNMACTGELTEQAFNARVRDTAETLLEFISYNDLMQSAKGKPLICRNGTAYVYNGIGNQNFTVN
jgi:hypothetical protein